MSGCQLAWVTQGTPAADAPRIGPMAQILAEPEVLEVLTEMPAAGPALYDRLEIFDYAVASSLDEN